MNKKHTKENTDTEKNAMQLPDWYWEAGLHDAHILSISELELSPNYKEKILKRNCLEIVLNSQNALFEDDIEKICLYNYEIKTPDIDVNKIDKPWWMSDTIEKLQNEHYLLEIEIEAAQGYREFLAIEFEIAEVIRK